MSEEIPRSHETHVNVYGDTELAQQHTDAQTCEFAGVTIPKDIFDFVEHNDPDIGVLRFMNLNAEGVRNQILAIETEMLQSRSKEISPDISAE